EEERRRVDTTNNSDIFHEKTNIGLKTFGREERECRVKQHTARQQRQGLQRNAADEVRTPYTHHLQGEPVELLSQNDEEHGCSTDADRLRCLAENSHQRSGSCGPGREGNKYDRSQQRPEKRGAPRSRLQAFRSRA